MMLCFFYQPKQLMTSLQHRLMWVIVVILLGIFMWQPCFSAPRDPTKPMLSATLNESMSHMGRAGVVVSAIIFSPDRKVATVNGRYLSVDDKIGNLQIVSIAQDDVTFKDEQGEFSIPVNSYVIKQEVNEEGKKP